MFSALCISLFFINLGSQLSCTEGVAGTILIVHGDMLYFNEAVMVVVVWGSEIGVVYIFLACKILTKYPPQSMIN